MSTLAALLLLYLYHDREYRKDYWQRLIDLKRIGKVWYMVILLTVPILTIIGILVDLAMGGNGAEISVLINFLRNPLSWIPFVMMTLMFGPLPEEMAWRGYALDGLQVKRNALTASLILGEWRGHCGTCLYFGSMAPINRV